MGFDTCQIRTVFWIQLQNLFTYCPGLFYIPIINLLIIITFFCQTKFSYIEDLWNPFASISLEPWRNYFLYMFISWRLLTVCYWIGFEVRNWASAYRICAALVMFIKKKKQRKMFHRFGSRSWSLEMLVIWFTKGKGVIFLGKPSETGLVNILDKLIC